MTRRSWLALALIALAISIAPVARAASTRHDQAGDLAAAFDDDVDNDTFVVAVATEVARPYERVAILDSDARAMTVGDEIDVITVAPKTSPPR